MEKARWCHKVLPPGGPCKAKCWFEFCLKCLKRELNTWSPVFRASMLTIRPWRLSWVGLIRAWGIAACCVWTAYSLRPSRFDCLRREGSQLACMDGARHPMGTHLIPPPVVVVLSWISVDNPWGGECMQVTHNNGGFSA